jgi:hypothetical protein
MRQHVAHTNFTAGEIADDIRFDLEKWTNGAGLVQNAICLPGGAATKRGGTQFVAHTRNNKQVRLVTFVWNVDQAYVLEFGGGYLRFYRNGGAVTKRGRPYQIPTRWTLDDVDRLRFCQSADVLFITHPRHQPYRLIRKADDDWKLKTLPIVGGPYRPLNSDVELVIKPSASSGIVKLVATADVFEKKHVGSIWQFFTPRNAVGATTWTDFSGYPEGDNAPDPWTAGTLVQHAGRTYKVTGGTADPLLPKDGSTPPTHTEGEQTYFNAEGETIVYRYLHDGAAAVKIVSVTDGRRAVGKVIGKNSIPAETVEDGTPYWQEGAWSALWGYPTAVAIHEQRLWFAGSPGQPQTVWGSKTGDFYDFTPGDKDDDALEYTLGSNEVDDIVWMASGRVLIVGTSSGEYVLRASRLTEAVTPTNITVTRDTNIGSAKTAPVGVDSGLVFMARHGKSRNAGRVAIDYRYDYRIDGFAASPLTRLAPHMLKPGGANQIAWTRSPVKVLWVARNDGELVAATLDLSEEVVAWHRHKIARGQVEDVAVIPGDEGDDLWLVVKRTVQGKPVRHIEVLQPGLDEAEDRKAAWFLDSALNYDGPPATLFKGLNHLNGEDVQVLADGKIYERTVKGGRVEIPKAAKRVTIGLPYTYRLRTLPIEAGMQFGTAQGREKIVPEVTLRLKASRGGRVGGSFEKMDDIFDKETGELFTGDKRLPIRGGWSKDGEVCIEHDTPYPFQVTAILMTVQTTEIL